MTEERHADAVLEAERLRGCLNDLVSALALPSVWKGGSAADILRTLLDAVLGMLDLDFAYARCTGGSDHARIELLRSRSDGPAQGEELWRALTASLGPDAREWSAATRVALGGAELTVVPILVGHGGELGVLVTGSGRAGFPQQTERLVLTVAANQAAIGLHQALLLREQKRVAGELDRRVARRTAELAAANEELRSEIGARQRAEAQLAGEKHLLERVASGAPLASVLEACCRFVETMAPGCRCGVCVIEGAPPRVEMALAPSLPDAFRQACTALPLDSADNPLHPVLGDLRQVIIEDSATDAHWPSALRPLLEAHGLRACWLTPIGSPAGPVLGASIVMRGDAGAPGATHRDLIAQLSHIASIAIERARDETALRRSEALLAEGQRLSATGTFAWAPQRNEITWSEQLHRIFGLDRATPVTLAAIAECVHPDDLATFDHIVRDAYARGGDFQFEHRLQMPDRSVRYLQVGARATRDADGRLEYIGAVQDVTQRRLAEQALERTRTELMRVTRITTLGALTASIAHEVNQPLSGIITNASTCARMLEADPPNLAGARETTRRTLRDGKRAAQVIARLRGLFATRECAPVDAVDLNAAVREVLALSWTELQGYRVNVRTELAADLPHVNGDRVQLQQVIQNLVRNAAEAMADVADRPRELGIRTERAGDDSVQVSVRDAGTGLAGDVAARLFDAFFTTKEDGMGIGLAISRSIVESHQGRLWAANNADAGATFAFALPCRAEAVAAPVTLGTIPILASLAS